MTETLCEKADVQLAAGANAPTLTDGQYTSLINMAEGFISTQSRYDWVTNYASVSGIGKEFLKDLAAVHAALSVVNNNMASFFSRLEAQTILDVLYSKLVDGINLLREDKFREFVIKGEVE
jgi:hypothetical protein